MLNLSDCFNPREWNLHFPLWYSTVLDVFINTTQCFIWFYNVCFLTSCYFATYDILDQHLKLNTLHIRQNTTMTFSTLTYVVNMYFFDSRRCWKCVLVYDIGPYGFSCKAQYHKQEHKLTLWLAVAFFGHDKNLLAIKT